MGAFPTYSYKSNKINYNSWIYLPLVFKIFFEITFNNESFYMSVISLAVALVN